MQSAASELELLEACAREAGTMARELSLKPLEIESKGEAGPVTNVDKAVDAMLEIKLLSKRPDYGWLSEETPDKPEYRLGKDRTFMLDPIDGTASLIGKTPQWTISIGIVQGNRAYAGAIYNPMTDEMFTGVVGHGAFFNGMPMKVTDIGYLEGARIIGQKSRFADKRWPTPWPKMDVIERHSIAYRMALVANGTYDAMMALSSKYEWDTAAGALIVQEAGGLATTHTGAALPYNQPTPTHRSLVCAGPALHAAILERTAPIRLP